MENYLNQLLEDLDSLMKVTPPWQMHGEKVCTGEDPFAENMMEFEEFMFGGKGAFVSSYTGITKQELPEVALLSDEQAERLFSSIMNLLEHYNLHPVFFDGVPARQKYGTIREHWAKFKAPTIDFHFYYEFCSYDKSDCPFPETCKGCDENDRLYEDMMKNDTDLLEGLDDEQQAEKEVEIVMERLENLPRGKFISSIHNYCDRWCERCSLKEYCSVYAVGFKDLTVDLGSCDWDEKWEETRRKDYERARGMIYEQMKDLNITAIDLARGEGLQMIDRELLQTREDGRDLLTIAECYAKMMHGWFTEERYEQMQENIHEPGILETITWYSTLIPTKMFRTMMPEDSDTDFRMDPVQSDPNGSAKVLLEAIRQSLYSWSWILLNKPEYKGIAMTYAILLQGMQDGVEEKFPNAEEFVRPGFDQERGEWRMV